MKKDKYVSALVANQYGKQFWMLAFCICLASNFFLSIKLAGSDVEVRQTLLPTVVDKAFTITGDTANPEYYEVMTRTFSSLILNYHKKNVDYQFETYLKYVDPSIYPLMEKRLNIDKARIKKNDITSSFHIEGMDIKKNSVILWGKNNVAIGSQWLEPSDKAYEFKYIIKGGTIFNLGHRELRKNQLNQWEPIPIEDELMIDMPVRAEGEAQ